MRTFALLTLCPLLLSTLVGCPCADWEPGWIEVGDGFGGFTAIADGAVLDVERGSQGGQHVYAGLIGEGMHPGSRDVSEGLRNDDLPWISFELEAADGRYSNDNELRQPLDDLGDGQWGILERRVSFRYWSVLPDNWTEIPREQREAELEAMDFTLRAQVDDACGDVLVDERTIRIAFP